MALNIHQQIWETIRQSENILLAFKKEHNGDAIASALALFMLLGKNKKAEIASEGFKVSRSFSFLPEIAKIQPYIENLRQFVISLDISKSKVGEISYNVEGNRLDFIISPKNGFFEHKDIASRSSGFKYDLIITLDTPDLESLGRIYDNDTEFFYNTPVINIDHNPDNEQYGQINHVSLTATSIAEILYELINDSADYQIDEKIATYLLTGMIAKTRSFKTTSVTPKALNIASELISRGASREEIVQNLYHNRTLSSLKLWGRVLSRLEHDPLQYIVWSYLDAKDFTDTKSQEEDLEGVIDELIANAPEAKVIILLYEKEDKTIKCLVNTAINLNALELTKSFDGAGTKNLVRFSLPDITLNEAQAKVVKEISGLIAQRLRK